MLEGHGEQRLIKLGLDSVEESGLGVGADSVDRAEGETEQTVIVLILHELGADLLSSLDSLVGSLDTTDGDSVLVDITAGTAAIAVRDRPASTGDLGSGAASLVDGMATLLRRGKLVGENPTISC